MSGQQVTGAKVLRRQDAIHGLQRELSPAVKEVGEVGLAKAGLARKQGHTQSAALNPADQFQTESFVHLGHVHVWKLHRQQWRG